MSRADSACLSHDILIVGGGGAGLRAAIAIGEVSARPRATAGDRVRASANPMLNTSPAMLIVSMRTPAIGRACGPSAKATMAKPALPTFP